MNISKVGIDLIKSFEGCYLKAYRCPAGVWTIGWGTTEAINGIKPHEGMIITQDQADKLLIKNLKAYENAVNKYVTYSINQNQFDALVSFAYNCGNGALKTSTLLKKLNAGDVQGAGAEFLRWNKANGQVLNGLTRRRTAEKKLFLEPIKDTVYEKAVQNLVLEGIIGSTAAWTSINLKNVPALISKIGIRLFDVSGYDATVSKMAEARIINSPGIWKDKKYTEQNVRDLIVKVNGYLG